MTIFNIIIMIVLAIETIYIGKSAVRDLNKILKFYKHTRMLSAIAKSVGQAKILAEQGKQHDCLQELDRACALITKATKVYMVLQTQPEKEK